MIFSELNLKDYLAKNASSRGKKISWGRGLVSYEKIYPLVIHI